LLRIIASVARLANGRFACGGDSGEVGRGEAAHVPALVGAHCAHMSCAPLARTVLVPLQLASVIEMAADISRSKSKCERWSTRHSKARDPVR